jgi:exosortase/archaeosortase family protein
MNKNFKNFLIKVVIFVAIIFLSRVVFQFPVEYFHLKLFQQSAVNRIFSKIDGLQVVTLLSILFGLYYQGRISKLKHNKPNWKKSILLFIGGEIAIASYYIIRASTNYFQLTEGIFLYIIQALIMFSLVIAFFCFLFAVFDKTYLEKFFKDFKKEIIIFAIIGVIMYKLLILFQQQWYFFSSSVTIILAKALSFFYPVAYVLNAQAQGGPILRAADFTVSIGSPCSGIDSLMLFFVFFSVLFALDKDRLKKGLYAIFFVIGLVGVYLMNVLRLFLLMLAGIHISPKFAVGLFHTNAGWILFIIYFLCYYWVIKRFIYEKKLLKQ